MNSLRTKLFCAASVALILVGSVRAETEADLQAELTRLKGVIQTISGQEASGESANNSIRASEAEVDAQKIAFDAKVSQKRNAIKNNLNAAIDAQRREYNAAMAAAAFSALRQAHMDQYDRIGESTRILRGNLAKADEIEAEANEKYAVIKAEDERKIRKNSDELANLKVLKYKATTGIAGLEAQLRQLKQQKADSQAEKTAEIQKGGPKSNPVQEDPAQAFEPNTRGINPDALPESAFSPPPANPIEEPLLRAGKEVGKATGGDVARDVLGGDADENTIRKRAAESAAKEAAKEAARIAREKVLSPEGNLLNDVGWAVSNAKDNFKGAFDTYYNAFINYFNHKVDPEGAFHKLMPPTSNQNSTSKPNAAGWPSDGH